MRDHNKERVISLQKALKIAKDALTHIANGGRNPEGRASDALYEIMRVELQTKPTPLQGLVGHGPNI